MLPTFILVQGYSHTQACQIEAPVGGKGSAEDLPSFLECYAVEAMTAAYLRFSNLGDFGRMKLSYPVLKAFLALRNDRSMWKKKVLPNIRDANSVDEAFPPGIDPNAQYPVKEGTLEDESECQTNEHNKTMQCTMAVSYTHLTLPTKRIV